MAEQTFEQHQAEKKALRGIIADLSGKLDAAILQIERLQKDYSDVRNAHDATCRQAGKLETERDNLLRLNDEMLQRFEEFGNHKTSCRCFDDPAVPCNCGFLEACIKAHKTEKRKDEFGVNLGHGRCAQCGSSHVLSDVCPKR